MTYTGGELNALNGKYGISDPGRSVPVMRLIRAHRPRSKEALYQLIASHQVPGCDCGVVSQGTIEDFGRRLHDVQMEEWGEYRHTLQVCIQWEYDLFVVQSLKGVLVEDHAREALQELLDGYEVREAEGFVDEESRVDLIVARDEEEHCGIQVKPLSYNYVRESVRRYNEAANRAWGRPVHYLYYTEEGSLVNLSEVVALIKE